MGLEEVRYLTTEDDPEKLAVMSQDCHNSGELHEDQVLSPNVLNLSSLASMAPCELGGQYGGVLGRRGNGGEWFEN